MLGHVINRVHVALKAMLNSLKPSDAYLGPVVDEFLSQRQVTFLDLRVNKRLSKQLRCRWFEIPLRSLWRHCNRIWENTSMYNDNQTQPSVNRVHILGCIEENEHFRVKFEWNLSRVQGDSLQNNHYNPWACPGWLVMSTLSWTINVIYLLYFYCRVAFSTVLYQTVL